MISHSPGPWRWEDDGFLVSSEPDGIVACTDEEYEPSEADAALIAAAPELLHLVRELISNEHVNHKDYRSVLDTAKALLARLDATPPTEPPPRESR